MIYQTLSDKSQLFQSNIPSLTHLASRGRARTFISTVRVQNLCRCSVCGEPISWRGTHTHRDPSDSPSPGRCRPSLRAQNFSLGVLSFRLLSAATVCARGFCRSGPHRTQQWAPCAWTASRRALLGWLSAHTRVLERRGALMRLRCPLQGGRGRVFTAPCCLSQPGAEDPG